MERFRPLLDRAGELGGSARRYIYNLEQGLPDFLARLEAKGKLDEIHLWNITPDPTPEMKIVTGLATKTEDQLADLSCYFALQLLQQNLNALALLRYQLRTRKDAHPVYRDFITRMGDNFESLVSAYIERVLDLHFGKEKRPLFTFFAVGTQYHQGDVDLGVIDDGSPARENLHRVLGKLKGEMLKRATAAHFCVSEHIGPDLYSASISEYRDTLAHQLQDFILINEMLCGRHLVGSKNLFTDFRDKITSRYFHNPDRDNRHHEGYLRGILGEIRGLRLRAISRTAINLHDDGLRLVQVLVVALRTVVGVDQVKLPEVLAQLWEDDMERASVYVEIEQTLVFLETFRLLHQLLIGEGDEVSLNDQDDLQTLRPIALAMGFSDSGPVKAEQRVLIKWQEQVDKTTDLTDQLLPFLTRHLAGLHTNIAFNSDPTAGTADEENVALKFKEVLAFQRGARYWDDLLQIFTAAESPVLRTLVKDLNRLDPKNRNTVIDEIAQWSKATFYSTISLLMAINKQGLRLGAPGLFNEITDRMFTTLTGTSNQKRRLINVFRRYPSLVGPFVLTLSQDQLDPLNNLLTGDIFQEELIPWRDRLLFLATLSARSSYYLKRYLKLVTERCPQVARQLDDPAELHLMAQGLFGDAEFARDLHERKRLLGEYYEIEFLRAALETLAGAKHQTIGLDVAKFTNNYVSALFYTCRQEVTQEQEQGHDLGDRFALFVTGGHARGQAYDDDYDMIALLDSPDPEDLAFANRVVSRMNREMTARGLIPHVRSADWSGKFVVTLTQLEDRLKSAEPDIFIDQSQLLEAQCVIGSHAMAKKLVKKVIAPLIHEQADTYTTAITREIASRREDFNTPPPNTINIKEGPGGLRDLELVALICKAKLSLAWGTLEEAINAMAATMPEQAEAFTFLIGTARLLNHVRASYRLSVAASNEIDLDLLEESARMTDFPSGEELAWKLQGQTGTAAKHVDQILNSF